jgi:hypothetical protein
MKFFSQSSACEVESAWSSCFPFGNATLRGCHSTYTSAFLRQIHKAVFDGAGHGMHAHGLVQLRLAFLDAVPALLDELLA